METLLGNTEDTLGSQKVCTKQQRIAEIARSKPHVALLTLSHYIDVEWLYEAYRRIRKDGAAGVDEVTAREYEEDLHNNLTVLLERFKSGSYKAPPVKRVYIPKDEKESRPIGIPTLEDKVLQRAVVMVLEPIYEHDFLDCSYGFRPGRSCHCALDKMRMELMEMRGAWVYEVDIRKYFDSVNHGHMREILRKRVGDGVLLRMVSKWLSAGVMEQGMVSYPEAGTPQGGVISPLLSNIYLHEALDLWFEKEIKPRLQGKAELIRYADDFLILHQRESDARRVAAVMPKRLGRYGLFIHEEKTRIVDFRKPEKVRRRSATFDFLGFTHFWGESQKGNMVVKLQTSKKKLRKSLRAVKEVCKESRHNPVKEQQKRLNQMLLGYYGYYGVPFNMYKLKMYYEEVKRCWRKWLNRRNRDNQMTWEKFKLVLDRYPLARPRTVHLFTFANP